MTADAIAATGGSYKGVALVPLSISDTELKRLDAAGFCGARFHYMEHLAKGPGVNEVIAFGKRLAPLGWHLQMHMEASLIAELAPALRRSPVPVVIDHMGRIDASLGVDQPAFRALLALLEDKNLWVKVSGSIVSAVKDRPTPTRCHSHASWWPSWATAACGARTGLTPTTRDRCPMTVRSSMSWTRLHPMTPHGRLYWWTIRSASTASHRRVN